MFPLGVISQQIPGVPVIATYTENIAIFQNGISCTKPSGVVAGDLLMIVIGKYDTQNPGGITDMVTPSGWNALAYAGNTATDCHTTAYWRIATGSEGATQWVGNDNFPSNNYDYMAYYLRITGANGTTPINVSSIHTGVVNNSVQPVLGVTTTVDNCLIILGFHIKGANATPHTFTSPYTKIDDQNSGAAASDSGISIGEGVKETAGATGDTTITCNVYSRGNDYMIAVAP